MIVPLFAQCCKPRHDQERLAELQRRQDRAHSRMRDDDIRLADARMELPRPEILDPRDPCRVPGVAPNLREDILSIVSNRPIVDRANHSVEGSLRSHGYEDHSTAPAYRG